MFYVLTFVLLFAIKMLKKSGGSLVPDVLTFSLFFHREMLKQCLVAE